MSTSIVVRLFRNMLCTFGKAAEGSAVCRLLSAIGSFFGLLLSTFKKSRFFNFLCKTADFFAACYGKSLLHGVLTGKPIENRVSGSLFYRIYGKTVNFFVNVVGTATLGLVELAKKSKILGGATERAEKNKEKVCLCFFGIMLFAMFCIPHSAWNNVFGLVIAILATLIVCYGAKTGMKIVRVRTDKTYFSVLLFFACVTFSTVFSQNVSDSVRIYMFFLTSFLLYFAITAFAATKNTFVKICAALYACVVVTGIVGVVQAILKVETDASLTDLTLNADMPGRVFSTLGNPNNFAQLLVLFMPFAAAFALTEKRKARRTALCVLLLIPFVSLLQTYSRSGWIAFAVAVMVFAALANRRSVPFILLLCVLAIPFLPESVLNRILTIGNMQDSSSSFRLVIWEGALDMLETCWICGVGIGPGAFKSVFPRFAFGKTVEVAHCHMQFLEIFLETGLIGLLSFFFMTFTIIKRSFVASSSKDRDVKYFAAAGAASMTSIIFIGFFEYYWFYPRVMFAFFVSAGLATAAYRIFENERKTENDGQ